MAREEFEGLRKAAVKLAEAQTRIEDRFEKLAEAQARTEENIARLTSGRMSPQGFRSV